MPILLLKLLGIGAWIKKGAYALLCGIKRYPWQAGLILALLAFAWAWRGWNASEEREAAAIAREAKAIKAGQQALANQIKLHDETKAAYAAKAKDADNAHEIEMAAAADRTERFIAAGGVHKACGNRASVASAPTESAVAESGNGQGLPSDLVAVTPADVRLCTANSLRLKAVHDWGEGLKAAGLATSE